METEVLRTEKKQIDGRREARREGLSLFAPAPNFHTRFRGVCLNGYEESGVSTSLLQGLAACDRFKRDRNATFFRLTRGAVTADSLEAAAVAARCAPEPRRARAAAAPPSPGKSQSGPFFQNAPQQRPREETHFFNDHKKSLRNADFTRGREEVPASALAPERLEATAHQGQDRRHARRRLRLGEHRERERGLFRPKRARYRPKARFTKPLSRSETARACETLSQTETKLPAPDDSIGICGFF